METLALDPRRWKVARLVGRNALVPYRHQAEGALREGIPDPDFTITAKSPRVASQALFSQYVKVSEGCSNTCSFCIIPKLRGPQRSRAIADIVAEAADFGGARVEAHRHVGAERYRKLEQVAEGEVPCPNRCKQAQCCGRIGGATPEAGRHRQVLS